MVRRSFADDSYGRASFARSVELRKVNALPCSERHLAVAHRKRHRVTDEDRFHVRGPVPLGVRVPRTARHGALQCGEHVLLDIGVRVLVHEDRRGRVRDADRDDPVADLRARDRGLDPRGDIDRFFALLGLNADLLMPDAHAVAALPAAPAVVASRCATIRAISAGVAFPPLTTRTVFRARGSIFPARTAASGAAPDGSTRSDTRSRYS